MSDRYYEDFKIGERFVSGGMTLTEAGIIEFARQWDPQPFHIDTEFAQKWQYGGIIASGLHTMCVTLKLWLELGVLKSCSLGSPGLGETQFPRPVRPGDTLTGWIECAAKIPSKSKPALGVIHETWIATNQKGELVMTAKGINLVRRRPS